MTLLPMLRLDNLIQAKNTTPPGMLKAAGFHINYECKGDTAEVYMPVNGKEYTVKVSHPDPDIALQNAVIRVLCEAVPYPYPDFTAADIYKYIRDGKLLDPADAHLLVPLLDSKDSLTKAIAILIIGKDE